MPVRFGYDESLPDNWTNTGDTYNGPGIASNMQSFGMNGSPYSALVPQGQANPFAGTLAMNPGATDTNNFGGWESQYSQPPPSAGDTPLISSPALTGGGQRPASAGGTGGYDPNWQSLLTPWNTTNPSVANDPDAWVRQLDQNSYYKYILPYQQRGGNTRDIAAMTKLIEDGLARDGGGQWNQGGQVKNVAGPKLDYLNDPNAYGNQNRGGYPAPAATQPGTTGQPTQNGSVGGAPQFNWPNLPQVDPATAYGGGVLDLMGRDSRGYAGQLTQGQRLFLASGGSPSDMMGMTNARYQQPAMQAAPGSMEERYAAMYGGGGQGRNNNGWGADPNGGRPVYDVGHGTGPAPGQPGYDPSRDPYLSRYPSTSSGMQGIGEVSSYNPFGSGPPPNYASGGFATGGMDQPWNQGGAGGTTRPGYMNTGYDQRGYNGATTPILSGEGRPATFQDLQNFYNSEGQNPNFDLTSLFQQYMGGGNGGQVSGYGGGAQGAPPGSMQQRNQAYFQNPGATFGSTTAGGGTPNSNGSGSTGPTPVMASPSFGFGSTTGRRTGYGNQNSYYGGSSNPNSFGGSNFGNFYTGAGNNFPAYSGSGAQGNYNNPSQNRSSTSGFAAGRTGRPSSFTF